MTCCEGWTTCNGVSLLVLLLLGILLNSFPLVVKLVDKDDKNPISCFEWWFPGIIGAGLMTIPAAAMALAARKRACCNNRVGMFLSSLFNVFTIIGATYCMMVSLQALVVGPLICKPQVNNTVNCEFSFSNFSNIDIDSFNLNWFLKKSCIPSNSSGHTYNNITATGKNWDFETKEGRHKTTHISAFVGLLIVGILQILFALSQMVIGLLGCLCGVSKKRNRYV
ncbi:transmembrane 4 L6 family member 20 [Suncus etruscus]|uniref:transmembrane 4 L6 family member 20 n=1 Tax=Suncus etruscus TaxID=109475 RepID=UPI00211042CC|nr:transmembrane 4 L6 family member 20 [Suncus etruscus]